MELIRTPKLEGVKMLDRFAHLNGASPKSNPGVLGTLYVTATHLIFVDQEGKRETWILYSHLSIIEKLSTSTTGTPLHIRCKNFRSVTFVIPKERDAHDLYTSLYQISQPLSVDELYCFHYTASNEDFQSKRWLGWDKFDLLDEYRRLGLPNEKWTITNINKNYVLCDTYPQYLVVPASANAPMLFASSSFRSKGRLPALTYLHENGAGICRCSQPLSGLSGRCTEDESLLNCILHTNTLCKFLYVVDTRPKINVYANRAAGKGYENQNYYENIKYHSFGIENIHVMRGSLQKLLDACELKVISVNAFLTALDGSNWLKHIKSVLETASFIATAITSGITVIVHCSDGWDRTAQTCSIASLLLDPYYRTIDGFEALIEKEWLAFGHKFTDRCGHIQTGDSKEIAPVFTQFIDCIWQITQQFPFSFEFNEKFLLTLHDHVYSCQFGTFIGNNEKERKELLLKDRSYSLWAYFDSQRSEYTNPLYGENVNVNVKLERVLDLNCSPQVIRFWRTLYNRFDIGIHPRESITDLMVVMSNHIHSLEQHVKYLEENIAKLETSGCRKNCDACPDLESILSVMNSRSGSEDSGGRKPFHGDSFDSVDSPLRIVQECMERLQQEHDNRQNQKLEENQECNSGADHPLISPISVDKHSDCNDCSQEVNAEIAKLISSMESVALDWQSFRNVKECHCSYVFDSSTRRYHCWSCGEIYCVRCMEKQIVLPGHRCSSEEEPEGNTNDCEPTVGGDVLKCPTLLGSYEQSDKPSTSPSPVCNYCYKAITQASSVESA